jgi:hypothetical protein
MTKKQKRILLKKLLLPKKRQKTCRKTAGTD